MIRVIDISFYASNEYTDIAMLVKQHQASLGYIDHLKEHVSIQVVKHLDYEGTEIIKNVKYSSFKSRNSFGHIPFKTIRYIKSEKPDMVIVQGLVFPIQLTRPEEKSIFSITRNLFKTGDICYHRYTTTSHCF